MKKKKKKVQEVQKCLFEVSSEAHVHIWPNHKASVLMKYKSCSAVSVDTVCRWEIAIWEKYLRPGT